MTFTPGEIRAGLGYLSYAFFVLALVVAIMDKGKKE